MRAVRDGLNARCSPARRFLIWITTLRVIGIIRYSQPPLILVSLSDDELTPADAAARVVLTKVMRQLVDAGEWRGA